MVLAGRGGGDRPSAGGSDMSGESARAGQSDGFLP